MSIDQATAFAPASVGNVGVGFDILGHVHDAYFDEITAVRVKRGVTVAAIEGADIPTETKSNTAAVAAQALLNATGAQFGVELHIKKGIPLASGLGGSAASAVAAVVAVNALLPKPLPIEALYPHALTGEAVASGALHGDNVAPSLLGGLQLVAGLGDAVTPVRIPAPKDVQAVVVHPDHQIRTAEARACLPAVLNHHIAVEQSAHLAGFIAACFQDDWVKIAQHLHDVSVELHRKHLIPGFDQVKKAAYDAGALGCSISGAGPAVFAWGLSDAVAAIGEGMQSAFADAGLASRVTIADVGGPGARLGEES